MPDDSDSDEHDCCDEPLYAVILWGRVSDLTKLFDSSCAANVNVNAPWALHLAVNRGNEPILLLLLERGFGANINIDHIRHGTPLQYALHAGSKTSPSSSQKRPNKKIISHLLKYGASTTQSIEVLFNSAYLKVFPKPGSETVWLPAIPELIARRTHAYVIADMLIENGATIPEELEVNELDRLAVSERIRGYRDWRKMEHQNEYKWRSDWLPPGEDLLPELTGKEWYMYDPVTLVPNWSLPKKKRIPPIPVENCVLTHKEQKPKGKAIDYTLHPNLAESTPVVHLSTTALKKQRPNIVVGPTSKKRKKNMRVNILRRSRRLENKKKKEKESI